MIRIGKFAQNHAADSGEFLDHHTSTYSAAILVADICAALHTARGVAGMAMFSCPSASVMALMAAAGAAMAPASPHPLMPSGLDGQGVLSIATLKAGRSLARGMV